MFLLRAVCFQTCWENKDDAQNKTDICQISIHFKEHLSCLYTCNIQEDTQEVKNLRLKIQNEAQNQITDDAYSDGDSFDCFRDVTSAGCEECWRVGSRH